MPVFNHDKGHLFYQRKGKGKTIILLHGILGSSRLYAPIFEELALHFDTISIDLPGHGNSDPLEGDFFGLTQSILISFMKSLNEPIHALIGQSMGGLLINNIIDDIKPKKVVYISVAFNPASVLKLPTRSEKFAEVMLKANKEFAKTSRLPLKILAMMGLEHWKDTGFFTRQILQADPETAARALNGIMHKDHPINYRKETEFLILHGKKDRIVPELKEDAKKLHARYESIPGANHAAMIERPNFVAESILKFIS